MTVLGITTASSPPQSPATSRAAQARQDFKDLGAALAAGDLTAAQQALEGLHQKIRGGGEGKSQNPDNARQLLSTLATALESGELTEAQQIFARLQQNMGEIKGKGHDHSQKGGRIRGEDTVTVGGTQLPPAAPEVPPAEGPTSGEAGGEIDVMA